MSILNKYRSIANEGIFDGILDKIKKAREEAKEDQLTSDKFIERIKSSKGPYTSQSLPNKYKKVFAVSKQQDIINYLISSDKNLNEYDFVGLANNLKVVFTQTCESLKAGKDQDDLNASASKKIVAAFKQHGQNSLSKSFIGNSKLNLIDDYYYRLEISNYEGNVPETIESIAVEKTVKDLTSKLAKTITSKRNEIVKAAGIIFKTDDEARRKYSEDVYETATDITFYPISLADTLYLFLEEISESYTNVFKYLYHCTLTVSNEGLLDFLFKKKNDITIDDLYKQIASSKEAIKENRLDNKYGKVFTTSDFNRYKSAFLAANSNLNNFKFKEIASSTIAEIPKGIKRISDPDTDNSAYTDSLNLVLKVLEKHFKERRSPLFLGNCFLFYTYDGYDSILLDSTSLKEEDISDVVYCPPSIAEVKSLAKQLYEGYINFRKVASEVVKLSEQASKKLKTNEYYDEYQSYVYNDGFWHKEFLDFIKTIEYNYTNVLKFLADCVVTDAVSKEAYSLEDGEETVTEEVQPELTETDETAENSSDENVETSEGMEETSGGDSEENTESDLSVSGQEDSEVDSTSQQETGAPAEEPFQEEREVELDDPDVEKQDIIKYLSALLGDDVSELTLFSAGEVNRPLYHVSMNPNVKIFSPKVSSRTLSSEDRSVPRVSTSTSLVGCLNGYQSMFTDMAGRERKNFTGLYTVYELPYQYAVKPSKKLLSDVESSDEYWLVSWKKETYSIKPNTVCEFTIPQVQTTYGSDGEDQRVTMFLKVLGESLYLTHDIKLVKGYYEITLRNYDYDYPLENNNKIEVREITENDYNKVTSLSIMIKKKG